MNNNNKSPSPSLVNNDITFRTLLGEKEKEIEENIKESNRDLLNPNKEKIIKTNENNLDPVVSKLIKKNKSGLNDQADEAIINSFIIHKIEDGKVIKFS